MMRSFWRLVGGGLAVLVLIFVTSTILWTGFVTEDYGMVCTRCLERKTVVDKSFCGIRYSRAERSHATGETLWLSQGNSSTTADSNNYELIFGLPCQHHFIRYGGFGRETAGVIADGRISQPPGLTVRLALTGHLFEAYSRVPEPISAREIYAMIDCAYPEDLDWHFHTTMPSVFIASELPNDPMSILYRGLQNVKTTADWRSLIQAANAHDGNNALLNQK